MHPQMALPCFPLQIFPYVTIQSKACMTSSHMKHWLALTFLTSAAALHVDVKLPALIGDHMVLQQGGPVRIWGWADPGEAVSIGFRGQKVSGVADVRGRWALYLKPLDAGAPAEMSIAG